MKSTTQMAADIVAAQSSHVAMTVDEIDMALKKVFKALNQCIQEEFGEVEM